MFYHKSENDITGCVSYEYIHLNSCGRQRYPSYDYTVIRNSGRPDWHILYICSGECTAVYDDKQYRLSAGDIVLYPPYAPQKYTFLGRENCFSQWAHFTGRVLNEIFAALNLSGGVYKCEPSQKISSVFNDMIQEHKLCQHMHKSAENALLIYLLTCISRQISKCSIDELSDIDRVILIMNEDFGKPYNPEKYAEICGLSQSRFSHKFKEITGLPPLKYFIGIKLNKAKEMLLFSSLNISEIADKLGYESASYFSRIFKSHVGKSPENYRKSHEEYLN